VRAVQCRKTGQEGPVRGKSGDCPCWRGCALVYGASEKVESGGLSVCLRLKLTSGRAWEERDKHGGTFDHFPRTDAAQSRAWANPHIVPAHRLTAMRLVRMHGHLTSCRSAQASVLSGLSTCVHRYATVWSLFEAPRSTCCTTLNAQQSRWLRRGSRENVEQ
jgi:hypothetical protein